MSEADLMGMDYECPDCSRKGAPGPTYQVGSFGVKDVEGLDLENCLGCRRVLWAQGGAIKGVVREIDGHGSLPAS
jgi:hypothetical protein